MNASTYTVEGMTCSCCSTKVSAAVREVAGVEDVEVNIETGQLTVTGTNEVNDTSIRSAISELGYTAAE